MRRGKWLDLRSVRYEKSKSQRPFFFSQRCDVKLRFVAVSVTVAKASSASGTILLFPFFSCLVIKT